MTEATSNTCTIHVLPMEGFLLSFEEHRVMPIVRGQSLEPRGPAEVRRGNMECLSDQETADNKGQRVKSVWTNQIGGCRRLGQ